MQADNAPQRVSKNPIEAVLLLSPPVAGCRSLPSFPSSGTLGCHLRSSLALRTHGDLLREVKTTLAPRLLLDGMVEIRQPLISGEKLSDSYLLPVRR